MGQYQRWLLYQEIDRRLRAELEALETELAQLEGQLDTLFLEHVNKQSAPLADNPIIRTLAAQLTTNSNEHTSSPNSNTGNVDVPASRSSFDTESDTPAETISPALLSWGGLPDFGPQQIEEPAYEIDYILSPDDYSEIELLPEDMLAFFDEHSQTDPQLELPWWLRNITVSSSDSADARPIDQESMRTNRLVQRWIERWGKQTSTTLNPGEESEDNDGE